MSAPQSKDGLETISAEPEDYRFSFDAHPTRVSITFNGVTVADSASLFRIDSNRLAGTACAVSTKSRKYSR